MAITEVPRSSKDLQATEPGDESTPAAPALETKLPMRKDASLKEFLSKMNDYAPIVSLHPPNYFVSLDSLLSIL